MTTTRQIEVSNCCGGDVKTHRVGDEGFDVCVECEHPCEIATIDITDCLICGEECFVSDIDKYTTTLECCSCDFQYQIIDETKKTK